jgi:hypothetical protein
MVLSIILGGRLGTSSCEVRTSGKVKGCTQIWSSYDIQTLFKEFVLVLTRGWAGLVYDIYDCMHPVPSTLCCRPGLINIQVD